MFNEGKTYPSHDALFEDVRNHEKEECCSLSIINSIKLKGSSKSRRKKLEYQCVYYGCSRRDDPPKSKTQYARSKKPGPLKPGGKRRVSKKCGCPFEFKADAIGDVLRITSCNLQHVHPEMTTKSTLNAIKRKENMILFEVPSEKKKCIESVCSLIVSRSSTCSQGQFEVEMNAVETFISSRLKNTELDQPAALQGTRVQTWSEKTSSEQVECALMWMNIDHRIAKDIAQNKIKLNLSHLKNLSRFEFKQNFFSYNLNMNVFVPYCSDKKVVMELCDFHFTKVELLCHVCNDLLTEKMWFECDTCLTLYHYNCTVDGRCEQSHECAIL